MSKWSRVEGSIGLNSKMFSQLLDISLSKNHIELHKRLLSCSGDLVAVEARYHRGSKNNCLSRYILGANQTPEKAKNDSNLEKVCLMLKKEIKSEMENDKCITEAIHLRSKVVELSEKHGFGIGQTMLRTSRLKAALEKVWPELTFIQRDGETDLVCLRDTGVNEAIARYNKLQKSLESNKNNEDILEDLSNVFIDENANDLILLHKAAILLRKRIQETKGLQNEYFAKEELQLVHQAKFIDPLLLKFMNWIYDDSLPDNCESSKDLNKKVLAVCSDITYLVTNVVTPKHLGLSIYLHHSFGSKKLIDDLHSHGYTLSYSEYRHFLTSAALHLASRQQQTLSGALIPNHMGKEDRSDDDPIIAAADNWDHNEATLSGKKSTHAMTSILVTESRDIVSDRIPRVPVRSVDISSLPGLGLANTLTYKKPTSRPEPFLSPIQLQELEPAKTLETKNLCTYETLYHIKRSLPECSLPSWTVFQSYVFPDCVNERSDIVYNPIIMAPPNDLTTVYTTLKRTKEQVNSLGQSVCPIVFDMGLWTKALEIIWARPHEFDGVVPFEGGMHFMMSLFGGIGFIYGNAGLKQLLVESDVFAKSTAEHVLSGKDFDRALRALIMVDEVLNRRMLFHFYRWAEKKGHILPTMSDSGSSIEEIAASGLIEQIETNVAPLLDQFRTESRSISPLFQFWDDYLLRVSLPMKLYLAASRHGMWDTFQYAKAHLLPFLFCSNRTVYARYMPYMVLKMNRLPDALKESFQKGKFVAKLSKGTFNCVWIDYVLEVTQNKSLKSSGGIIGITHNDKALIRWFLSRPLTAKYATEYQSDENHQIHDPSKLHTDTPYNSKVYNESVNKMMQVFQEGTFIDPFCIESSPSMLVNIATGVPAPADIAESLLGCHSLGKKMLDTFVKERFQVIDEHAPKKKFFDPMPRTKVKPMIETKSAVKLKNKTLSINGEEMYLRLLAQNAYKKVPLERLMSFENAPFPLSLFNDDGSKCVTKKSDLMQKLEGLISAEDVIRECKSISDIDCMVFDGMAIVQVQKPKTSRSTYQEVAEDFWRHIISMGVSNLHVVFDKYEEKSIKLQTRIRRGENVTCSAPVSIQSNMIIGDWKQVMTSTRSKGELTKFYTMYLLENCHTILNDNVQIFIAGGLVEKVLLATCTSVTYVQSLYSNQEEAYTRMLLHLTYAVTVCGANTAVICSPDTDVLVLLVHHFDTIGLEYVYFKTGRTGSHADNTGYIPVHKVVNMLSLPEKSVLLATYCITGCDTCSAFFGIGKKRAFNVLQKYSGELFGLSRLGQSTEITSVEVAAATHFVGLLYGDESCISLNSLRRNIVSDGRCTSFSYGKMLWYHLFIRLIPWTLGTQKQSLAFSLQFI